jgi:hypothetical protein
MRDIRNDLQDRANLIEDEIGAAQDEFEKRLEQLKSERETKLEGLKTELAAVGKLLEAEYRRIGAHRLDAAPRLEAVPTPAPTPLADFFVRRISEAGAVSKDELRRLAVSAGYFPDLDSAGRGVHAALITILKGGRVRELPNGTLAPATMMDTIRQRRAI